MNSLHYYYYFFLLRLLRDSPPLRRWPELNDGQRHLGSARSAHTSRAFFDKWLTRDVVRGLKITEEELVSLKEASYEEAFKKYTSRT